jgi:hypothetical protein
VVQIVELWKNSLLPTKLQTDLERDYLYLKQPNNWLQQVSDYLVASWTVLEAGCRRSLTEIALDGPDPKRCLEELQLLLNRIVDAGVAVLIGAAISVVTGVIGYFAATAALTMAAGLVTAIAAPFLTYRSVDGIRQNTIKRV